ncbi:MAG: acetaldehyde dehydrogenase/alcohol dehydrogenase [Clostridium sp.]|jgi:acetaldehyde dehydrogenase/alcohol dehydrogenase
MKAGSTILPKKTTTERVTNIEELNIRMEEVREAQRIYSTFTQEQVDHIFKEASIAANVQRIPLAKLAVEETGMGLVEDKVIKNHYASEYIYNCYKDSQTVGVFEHDEAGGISKIYEPIGVLAAVVPTTNPTSTGIFYSFKNPKWYRFLTTSRG